MSFNYTILFTAIEPEECFFNVSYCVQCLLPSGSCASSVINTIQLYTIINGTNIPYGLPYNIIVPIINGVGCTNQSIPVFISGTYFVTVTVETYIGTSSSIVVTANNCICIHPDMLIETKIGIKKIKDVIMGDEVKSYNDEYIKVIYNIKSNKTALFYIIPKNSLGVDTPNEDFYIHGEHPIEYNGNETLPRNLIGIVNGIELISLDKAINVYTLCTENRTVFKISGELLVYTFERQYIEKITKDHGIIYITQ
jgi:hypothetical protein